MQEGKLHFVAGTGMGGSNGHRYRTVSFSFLNSFIAELRISPSDRPLTLSEELCLSLHSLPFTKVNQCRSKSHPSWVGDRPSCTGAELSASPVESSGAKAMRHKH